VPKAQRMQQQPMMGRPGMNANPQQMMQGGGFNPMMASGFMNPYGGFPNPMMAANFMANTGGGGGNMRGGSQGNYMNRGGRGGGMMGGYGDGSGFNNGKSPDKLHSRENITDQLTGPLSCRISRHAHKPSIL
jgi:hypothetical protein